MSSKVQLKRSSVASKVPLVADLDYGELSINYADGKLYFKNSSNVIKSFTIDDSVVTLTGTQTLTNKTLSSTVLTGTLTAGGGVGTAGQVLQSTGSGLQWVTASGSGTVTSVAALTIGTTGTDVSSTVATGTTTPVITLNIPTASATNRGALSATDWTTFNNKTSNTGTVTSVSGAGTVSGLTLTGTITTSGSLTLGGTLAVTPSNFSSQTANTFLAAPNGSAGAPTFRTIVADDVPTLNQNTTGNAATATTLQTARLINGVSFNGSADITVAAAATTLTGTTLNSTVVSSSLATVGPNLTVPGVYGNTYITTFGSMFIDGTSTNNIVQTSSNSRTNGIGLWSTGGTPRIYSAGGIDFRTGATLRDRDTPTGGVTNISIAADGTATFLNTITGSISGNAATATTATNQSGGTVSATTLAYTGTLTGGTDVINIGSGQFYKDASGNIGIGNASSLAWASSWKAVRLNDAATISARSMAGSPYSQLWLMNNGYRETDDASPTVGWKTTAGHPSAGIAIGTGAGGDISFYKAGWTANNTALPISESMRIDSAGNVGIGTSSPGQKLEVAGSLSLGTGSTSAVFTRIWTANGFSYYGTESSVGGVISTGTLPYFNVIRTPSGAGTQIAIGATISTTFASSGNVGIGTTTINARLHVTEANKIFDSYGNINVFTSDSTTTDFGGAIAFGGRNGQGTDPYVFGKIKGAKESGGTWNGYLAFGTTAGSSAVTERMRLDSSGNLGLGVTPSAWNSAYKVVQIGSGTVLSQPAAPAVVDIYANAYIDSGFANRYIGTAAASHYEQNGGEHRWFNAPSGTAGNAITFTERMRITSAGNVGIGTSSPTAQLDIYSATNGYGGIGLQGYSTATKWYLSSGISGVDVSTFSISNSVTGVSPSLAITNAGNVGIGTTTPGVRLQVNNAATVGSGPSIMSAINPIIYADNGSTANGSIVIKAHAVGAGNTNGALRFVSSPDGTNYNWAGLNSIVDVNSTAGTLAFYTASGNSQATAAGASTERMRITSAGNVGIGTTAPTEKLDVVGNIKVGGLTGAQVTPSSITMDGSFATTTAWNALKFYLFKSGVESYGFSVGNSSNLSYWAGSTNSGSHNFYTSQTLRFGINLSGAIGLGSTPSYGTSGQVLTSAGSTGVPTWTTPTVYLSAEADTLATVTARGNTTTSTITHGGLVPSAGTEIDQIYSVTDTLTLTTSWQDTSVNANELVTGSYMVQVMANDYAVGGGQYTEYYTGIMSWYSGDTNEQRSDEIVLHRAGLAANTGAIFLRVLRTFTADVNNLKLQIAGITNNTGTSNYAFKFRRMI